MDVVTLRLEPSLIDELDEEAEKNGFSNRTEYIRFTLRNRSEYESIQAENTTDSNVIADLEERISALETQIGKSPADAENRTGKTDHQQSNPYPSGAQNTHLDSGKPLTDQMNEKLDELHVPGRKPAVERTRRDAIAYAWEYLREHGEATSSEIANATFGEFFDDDHLGYSASSRYPGYQLWDSTVRDRLVELPGVEAPGPRGSVYRFDEEGER